MKRDLRGTSEQPQVRSGGQQKSIPHLWSLLWDFEEGWESLMALQRLSSFPSTDQLMVGFYLEAKWFNFCCQAELAHPCPRAPVSGLRVSLCRVV